MAFVLKTLNKIAVQIKGNLPDENGKPINFDFVLHCKRLTQDEIEAVIRDKDGTTQDFVRSVAEGWSRVLGEDGAPLAYSEEGLDALLSQAGMPVLVFQSYIKQVGAVAKN